MTRSSRMLVAVCSLALLSLFALPLWHISLEAPQYPEGLGMTIWVNRIAGNTPHDLQNINGLNHYIGMHPIRPEEIPELRIFPWVVAALGVLGLAVAAAGRRRLLYGWAAVLLAGAVVGLVDFYRWEYEYGHDLDPDAALKIPGASFQPPLIGSKQILNFVAHSWPGVGGWLVILAGLVVAGIVAFELRRGRQQRERALHDEPTPPVPTVAGGGRAPSLGVRARSRAHRLWSGRL